jgi:hypothetical protein
VPATGAGITIRNLAVRLLARPRPYPGTQTS